VRGLGKLEIYGAQLTDGVEILLPQNIRSGDGLMQNIAGLQRSARPGADGSFRAAEGISSD
jgi:hypothetical protein